MQKGFANILKLRNIDCGFYILNSLVSYIKDLYG